jgi:hypothetical protein
MHRDLVNSQAHGEFLQISVYAEEHYIVVGDTRGISVFDIDLE